MPTPDVIGVELGAAMKNVIALCAGICDGLGYGDNTKALLMTRGLTEVARLGMSMGAKMQTFAGLAGVGDLHRHMHVDAFAQPPRWHPHWAGHERGGGHEGSWRRGRRVLCSSIRP